MKISLLASSRSLEQVCLLKWNVNLLAQTRLESFIAVVLNQKSFAPQLAIHFGQCMLSPPRAMLLASIKQLPGLLKNVLLHERQFPIRKNYVVKNVSIIEIGKYENSWYTRIKLRLVFNRLPLILYIKIDLNQNLSRIKLRFVLIEHLQLFTLIWIIHTNNNLPHYVCI